MEQEFDRNWVRPYLNPDEYVLWTGRPGRGRLLSGNDVFMIPFSILWCGMAIYIEHTAFSSNAPLFFKLWGIPFVLFGLYITVGRFIHMAYLRRRTQYAVTNQKLISVCGQKVHILRGNDRLEMRITVRSDGSGTIRFGPERGYAYANRQREAAWPGAGFAFENIADVARIEQIVQNSCR